MEIEVFQAFTSAGIPEDKARTAVDALRKDIDRRYSVNSDALATRKDLAVSMAQVDASIARLDARLGVAIASGDARLEVSIANLDARLEVSIANLDARIANLDGRLELTIAKLCLQISESRDQTIRWTISTMVALVAVSFAAAKGLWG